MLRRLTLMATLVVAFFAYKANAQCGSGATITVEESRCEATGVIMASGATGVGPFLYDFTSYPVDYAYTGASSSSTITALNPGSYTLRIIDQGAGNCFTDYVVSVPGTYVQPLMNTSVVDVTNCYNGTNGSITAALVDGRLPYSYEIIAGPMAVGTTNTNGIFSNLGPGTYDVRGYDSCGNYQTRQVTIGNFYFSPNSPVVTKTGCGQYSFDAINPNATMSGYTYKVKDANGTTIATGASLPIAFSHPDGTIANAQVCITDACGTDGCVNFSIADWSVTGSSTSYTACNQWTTSSITISGTPTAPITYGFVRNAGDTVWSSSLPFSFGPQITPSYWWGFSVVKDGCGVVKASPNIYEQFMLFWGGVNNQYYTSCTEATIEAGIWHSFVNPVSFSLNGGAPVTDGDNTYNFTNLPDGSYTIVATDACGSTFSYTTGIGHDWTLGGFSEPYCTFGEFNNYVSVQRRMKAPIVYEQWDASYSTLLGTQTWSDPSNIYNAWYGPSDWYASVTFPGQPNVTYNYIATDDCGRKDTITIINGINGHVPNTLSATMTPLCVNKGNITANFTSDNPTWNDILIDIRNINTQPNFSTAVFTGQATGSYSWYNLDTGTYQIMIKNRNCSDTTFYTIEIPKYVQPRLRKSIAFNCAGGNVNVVGSTKGGLKPYQYEIFQTFPTNNPQPLQSSNLFTLSGTYTLVRLRVVDACGNTSLQDLAVRPPAKPIIKVVQKLPVCNLSMLNLYVDSIFTGATYEWFSPSGASLGTNPSLDLPVTVADTGLYKCRVVIAGTCYDDTAKFHLRAKEFGCYAQLGNYVWNDTDKDGVQDAGEVGVAGVTVTLYDNANTIIATTVTDAYGYYLFQNLNPGTYHVGFTLPSNYVFSPTDQGGDDTKDSDPNTVSGLTGNYTLVAGDSNMTVDAGIYMPTPNTACLGNYVWNDLDVDGVQDANELGFSGVTVMLYDGSGNAIASTVTDATGFYYFCDLIPGTYSVGFSQPIGYVFSPQDQGGNDATDSDVNPSNGMTQTVTLAAGENNFTLDAGLYSQPNTQASLGNYVWYDNNNNGVQNAGEGGVQGVTVTLYASDGTTTLATTTTDEFGYYIFNNLTPGDYVVGFSNIPAGYGLSANDQGGNDALDSDADAISGKTPIINLSAGEHDMTWDAGIFNPSTPIGALGNYVWYDQDNDGLQDANETGVPGVTVTLYDGVGTILDISSTNAQGYYIFNNLPAGNYQVGFSNLPPGYKLTASDVGSNDAVDSDPNVGTGLTPIVVLATAEVNLTLDAGIVFAGGRNGTASLGDIVWLDANQNGIQDNGEQGVAGVTVTLYEGDGTTVISTTTTDALGNYIFTGLDAGNYVVGFSNIPAGHTFTTADQGTDDELDADADATSGGKTGVIGLAEGEENLSIDAGVFPAPGLASLGNYVWNDLNQDGVQDGSEPGVPGVTVTLFDPSGNPLAVTTTDANGLYQFTGLTPGTYYVEFSNLPAGFEFTGPDAGGDDALDSDADPLTGSTPWVTLVAGQNYPDFDAGIFTEKAGLGNYVWNDVNNNGIQDANEDGIPGITVTLYAANGTTPISSTVTNANGFYTFVNLDPGTYIVGFSGLPAGATLSPNDQGGDDALDSDANPITAKTPPVTLGPGDYDPTLDAGIHLPQNAGLGNYVWFDIDKDGTQDASEPGVAGVTVTLFNASGVAIQTAVTNESGFYSFPNLIPGTYSVGFSTLPPNRGFTSPDAGGNDATDSDVSVNIVVGAGDIPLSGQTPPVTLADGEYNPTLDLGLVVQFPTALTSIIANAALQGNVSTVNWVTRDEKDVNNFAIQRSTDGAQFTTVAVRTAKGNTQGETNYSIKDNVAELMDLAVIYYRVIANDIDGKQSMSNTVSVRPMQNGDPVQIYPSPFSTEFNIAYPSEDAGVVLVTLTDVLGNTIRSQSFDIQKGTNTLRIDQLNSLAKGTYYVKLVNEVTGEQYIKKLLKK